jgi:hypothetical protein
VPKLACPFGPDASGAELLGQVAAFYHQTLKGSPEALAYLEKRGIRDDEAVERFKLGYANRTLGYRLPAANRTAGAELRGRLQGLGVLRESGHEHLAGSLVVPIFDEAGLVAGMYGRKIGERLREGTPLHLYLPGPHRGVWNWEALRDFKEIVLCESLIDGLTFWTAGYRNVTASFGVEGFTRDHWALFRRYAIERVLIAYDRDAAGERAAEALAGKLISEGIEVFRIQFSRGMDANEYALAVKPAEKSLGALIRGAEWMGKGAAREGSRPLAAVPGAGLEDARAPESEEAALDGGSEPIALDAPGEPAGPGLSDAMDREPPAQEELSSSAAPLAAASIAESAARDRAPRDAGDGPATSNQQPATDSHPLASPVPPAPKLEVPVETRGEDVHIALGDRRYRVRGLDKNLAYGQMKVNVLVTRGDGLHADLLDLYSSRSRKDFAREAASELGVKDEAVKRDLGRVLMALETLQEARISAALEPKTREVSLTEAEREAALDLWRDPRLLERILGDFEKRGIVGEETNKLLGYLAAVSRKLEEPLAVIIQSSSAAGKTSLMEAVLAMVPDGERVKYSAMTGQSLFYMSDADLKHKVLAIVEEEGAERASHALKLLQSEGELTIASTGKDPQTGRLVTHEYRVEGPVMILLTTTAAELDEELLNRCIVLTVDGCTAPRPGADPGHPPDAAGAQDAGRAAGAAGTGGRAGASPERPEALAPAGGGQSLCEASDVPRRPDANQAGPREVPEPDRRHRVAVSIPAAREDGPSQWEGGAVHRGDARRHRDRQPSGSRGAGPVAGRTRSPNPAAADAARRDGLARVRAADAQAERISLHVARGPPAHGMERHAIAGAPGAAGGTGVRAGAPRGAGPELRLRTALRRGRQGRTPPAGGIDRRRGAAGAASREYDANLAGFGGRFAGSGGWVRGVFAGSKRGQRGGVAGCGKLVFAQ